MKKVLLALLLVGVFSLVGFAGTPSMTGTADFYLTFGEDGLGMSEGLRYGRFDLNLSDEATDGTGYYIKVRFPSSGIFTVYDAYAYHTFSLTEEMSLTGYFGRYQAWNGDYIGFWNNYYSGFYAKHDGIALKLAGTSGDISYGVTPFLYVSTKDATPSLGVDLLANVALSGVSAHLNVLGVTEGATDMVIEANGLVSLNDFVDLPAVIDLFAAYKTETNFATNTVNTVVSVGFDPLALVNEFTVVMEKDKDAVMTEEFEVSYAFMDVYSAGIYGSVPLVEDAEYEFKPYFTASYDAVSYEVYLDFYLGGDKPAEFGTTVSFSF
jgi:hypothetical protein